MDRSCSMAAFMASAASASFLSLFPEEQPDKRRESKKTYSRQ